MRGSAPWPAAAAAALLLLLAALPSAASNLGFRIERTLEHVPGGLSYYVVSLPFRRAVPDLWDTAGRGLGQDGLMQSDDLLVDWWTGGDGVCDGDFPGECYGFIALLRFTNDPASPAFNRWSGQTIIRGEAGPGPVVSGFPFDVLSAANPGEGFLVQVYPSFPVTIFGSDNQDVLSFTMVYQPRALNYFPFSLPPNTMYQTSQDLLRGIPDTDWGGGISILRFINDPADPQFNRWLGQTLVKNPVGTISGTPFPLVPGEGYLFQLVSRPPNGTVTVPLPRY